MTARPGLLARLRRTGAVIAIIALLWQLGLPVGVGSAAPWPGGMALCHAGGTAADRAAPAMPGAPDHACQCPLCFLLQAGSVSLAPPDGVSLAVASVRLAPSLPRLVVVHLAQTAGVIAQPRAPPASV